MIEQLQKIKIASLSLLKNSKEIRSKVLSNIALELKKKEFLILEENKKDVDLAIKNKLSSSLIDRLKINDKSIESMIKGIHQIIEQEDIVGKIISSRTRDDGLIIKEQKIPLGVILMIFESRPNVVIDSAALAIKSGNAIILKGGKEAYHSNKILGDIINKASLNLIDVHAITVLESDNRENINELIKMKDYIDVVIPRGGENLVHFIYENSKIPVIAHFKGLCHIYLDEDCDFDDALKIVINAKTQRSGVCNAMETLIIHEALEKSLLPKILETLKDKKTHLILDKDFKLKDFQIATEIDWETEYLDNILSIKKVHNIGEAIAHINRYGSKHSEAIVSNNQENIDLFLNSIDASCLMVNASTRFNDGSELGLGAELGISTSKLHAYGPMGVNEMMTTRHLVVGQGHIRS